MGGAGAWAKRLKKGWTRVLWSDINVLFLGRDLHYTGVCIYQNSSKGTLKINIFCENKF